MHKKFLKLHAKNKHRCQNKFHGKKRFKAIMHWVTLLKIVCSSWWKRTIYPWEMELIYLCVFLVKKKKVKVIKYLSTHSSTNAVAISTVK